MPVKFSTLFFMGSTLTAWAQFGPLGGTVYLIVLTVAFIGSNNRWVKYIVTGLVVVTVGLPAVIIAGFLWVIVWVFCNLTNQLETSRDLSSHHEDNIIEGEFVEVR